jgi:hypothetical protein
MAKHKLILEDVFEEVSFTLIAIHCSLEDYRLAYLLNKKLDINLTRNKEDLDYDTMSASYSIFEWEDLNHLITWSLVSNACRKESETSISADSLFGNDAKAMEMHHLISEFKNVDYFLKIDTEDWFSSEKLILNSIQKIPHIVTAYTVDASQLKSKNNLIFN